MKDKIKTKPRFLNWLIWIIIALLVINFFFSLFKINELNLYILELQEENHGLKNETRELRYELNAFENEVFNRAFAINQQNPWCYKDDVYICFGEYKPYNNAFYSLN